MHRFPFLLLASLLCAMRCYAQGDTVIVHPQRYAVDQELGLILVADDIAALNAQSPVAKRVVLVHAHVTLRDPVDELQVGVAYTAMDDAGAGYTLYFTDLPVVWIDTPHEIVDEPKVPAQFRMCHLGEDLPLLHIGIELRGGWSQGLPKKSYRIGFRAGAGTEVPMDVALLGMRSDDDWIMVAQYGEPLRLGTDLGQQLWMDMHQPYYAAHEPQARSGIRMEHVEVVLNGRYHGVYALGEPMDRKQLRLKAFEGIARGKLYKAVDWGNGVQMSALQPYDNNSSLWSGFEYMYPDAAIDWSDLHGFVGFVVNADDDTFRQQVPTRFQIDNAVDYFLLLNLTRATDNWAKNIHLARYDLGEPYFYVPWDLDGIFGVQWHGEVDPDVTGILGNRLYHRLLADCSPEGFPARVRMRWQELRAGLFDPSSLLQRYHDGHDRLQRAGAYHREEMAWVDFVYDASELDRLQRWIDGRVAWLDDWMDGLCVETAMTETEASKRIVVYPNPARDRATVHLPVAMLPLRLLVHDATGRRVMERFVTTPDLPLDLTGAAAGYYHVTVHPEGQAPVHARFIVND